MSREFISRCINCGDRHPLGNGIYLPTHEPRQCVAEWTEQIITHHEVVETHIEHNLAIRRVVRVHRVEHITHGHVNPYYVRRGSFARHQSHTIAILGVPSEWKTTSKRQIKVNQNRLIVNNNVTISDRHVMHH